LIPHEILAIFTAALQQRGRPCGKLCKQKRELHMKYRALLYPLLGLLALVLSTSSTQAQNLVSFSVPGAGTVASTGTIPSAINAKGTIIGVVIDNQFGEHGFVKPASSPAEVFDVPGSFDYGWTVPTAINDFGYITGYFANIANCEAVNLQPLFVCYHAFIRNPNGTFVIFDAPDNTPPGFSDYIGIIPQGINNSGVVTGWYFMRFTATELGFVRDANGKFTVLGGEGYEPNVVNDSGVVSGTASLSPDSPYSSPYQGFIATRKGILKFTVPGTVAPYLNDQPNNVLINDFGVVAGDYYAQFSPATPASPIEHNVTAGFLRSANGKFTTFASLGGPLMNLKVNAMNSSAITTGYFQDSTSPTRAFVRYDGGKFYILGLPSTSLYSLGTGINDKGVAVGWWQDTSGLYRGFIWQKK